MWKGKTGRARLQSCRLDARVGGFSLRLLFGTGNRGTYRFLFVVLDKSVYVVHVRHRSMLSLSPPKE
jgi:hypothetical protein